MDRVIRSSQTDCSLAAKPTNGNNKVRKTRMEEGDSLSPAMINFRYSSGGAVAQLGARLDGIEEVVGSNPIGSTKLHKQSGIHQDQVRPS